MDLTKLLDQFDENYHPLVRLAKQHGSDAVRTLLEDFGGTKPHLPTLENFTNILTREVRNRDIRGKFNGRNYSQLQIDFQLSERQLRQILHGQSRKYQRHNEPTKTIKVSDENHDEIELLAADYGSTVRAVTDIVLRVALKHKDIHAALRKEAGGEQMKIQLEEAA